MRFSSTSMGTEFNNYFPAVDFGGMSDIVISQTISTNVFILRWYGLIWAIFSCYFWKIKHQHRDSFNGPSGVDIVF